MGLDLEDGAARSMVSLTATHINVYTHYFDTGVRLSRARITQIVTSCVTYAAHCSVSAHVPDEFSLMLPLMPGRD